MGAENVLRATPEAEFEKFVTRIFEFSGGNPN
jgi:hypothetical protein